MRKKLLSYLKTTSLALLGICCFSGVYAQTTIVSANFNGSAGDFSSTSNLTYVSGNSTSSNRPASLSFVSEGTNAGACTNAQTTISTSDINTSAYCNNKLSFRLAAWSLNSTNGLDESDVVMVEISTNGGSSYTDLLEVTGKSQAFWHYSTGTAVASVPFSSTAGVTVFTPSSGGGRTSDGYSTVEITNLPSISNLRVRITLDCDNTNERWTIDDFKLTGDATATTPTVSISTPSNTVCSGSSVTFSSTVSNGGTTPGYQWLLNGSNISGANSSTYTTSSLSNSNQISLRVTSSGSCTPTATSSATTMTVNPNVTPSVSITASQNNVCSGSNITFNATPTNGGSAPQYAWFINGTAVSGQTNNSFSTTSLNNNDAVVCSLTSNVSCRTANTVASNSITALINANVSPTVSVSVNNNNVCAGTSQTFSSSITNGGAAPTYQWTRNGSNISGASSSTYSSSSLSNGDVIGLVLTSNANCRTANTATASTITAQINANVTPTASISVNNNNVCAGTSQTFSSSITNGGAAPAYQWTRNGSNISGASSATYTSTSLSNGDVIGLVLTSNANCRTANTATASTITAQINANVTPTASISVNTNNVCTGTSQNFTSSITNGGASPSYQWTRNGSNISGATSATYTSTSLSNGDAIGLVLTSNATCRTANTATASSITAQIRSNTTATVSITSSSTSICPNTTVTFNSSATNQGNNPTYSWRINGVAVNNNSSTFVTDTFTSPNSISLVLTPSADACPALATTSSNNLALSILAGQNFVVASATSNQICRGSSVQLNASASTTPRFDTAFINGFESSQAAWTLVNGSTGGSSSSRSGTSFTYRVSPYNYGGNDHISNDNSRFVFANSENHSGATNVSIISPSFSTASFSSANLDFFHYFNDDGNNDIANVSISTNGTTWTTLQSYTNDEGSRTNFTKSTLSIPSGFLNQSSVFVRFNYSTTQNEKFWAIDNVLVSGIKNHEATYSWDDQNNSNVGNQANISSFSPLQTANLTLKATNIFGCSSNRTVAVQVDQPTQNGSISGDQMVCRGINAGVLQVQNKLGNVVKWQWSTSGNVWNDVSSNLDSLIFSNLTTQRQFRAEVKNGVCASAFTPNFPVNVKNKNWTGEFNGNWFDSRNWCGGIPDSTEDVDIPNGTLFNPILNGNLTIQNLSLNDTIFVGSNSLTIKGNLNGQGKIKTTANSSLNIEGNGGQLNLPFTDANNSVGSLVVNRSSGVKIDKSVTINNLLNLTNGNVTLDNSDLSLGRNANIQGGHSNSYLKTSGTGQVSKDFNSNETFTFPVGNSSYNAATIKNKDGGVMGVRIEDLLRTDCASGNAVTSESVNRTWHITKNGANASGVDLTFQWNSSDELTQFNRSLCYASHCNSSNNTWEKLSSGSKSASGSGPYSISYTNYMGTFSPFGIGSGNGALPVTWVQVAAKKVNETTLVTWSTASEKGTDRFEIERSLNGKSFEKIGQVSAVGNSNTLQNYSFRDAQTVSSTSYYRIKSVDFDGTTEYSKTVMVQFNALEISTFPNPTTGKIFLQGVDKAEIEIVNTLGKVVSKFNFNGNSNSEIDLAQLPDGIYFISITQNQTTQQIRVVKSNP